MMAARSIRRRRDPCPVVHFGVPFMFDIQTELHLRRIGQDACTPDTGRGMARALPVLATLSGLVLLAAALG